MRNRLVTFVAILALGGVVGKFYATPLLAQVRAALVQNRDEKARNPYQEHIFIHSIAQGGDMSLTFSTVPAGKRLVITNINVDYTTWTPGPNTYVMLGGPAVNMFRYFPATTYSAGEWVANADTLAYFDAGQTPKVYLNANAYLNSGDATLAGYVIDVP